MALTVNLRHLDAHNVQLEGELPVEELKLDVRDETIKTVHPLKYNLEVQKLEDGLLAKGNLALVLDCDCVRCLKPFEYPLEIPHWACHIELQGEEPAPVINDCVDLTPFIREDILLEFPRHPVCESDCPGLPKTSIGKPKKAKKAQPEVGSSAWAELNKLKLD